MDQFRKFLARTCALLFTLSGITALLLFNIERTAFTSAGYKQAFEDQKLYERMPEILASALFTSTVGNANADPYLEALSIEDWNATITSLLPPEELKSLADNTLDAVFDYVNGKTDSAVISLLPFKSHLTGNSGVEAVRKILQAQPPCTAEQLLQIGLGFIQSGDVSLCNPPEELMGFMTPLIESQLQVMTIAVPDQVTLIPDTRSGTPADPRAKLNWARTVMKITPVFPLLFLFGITIFAVRSFVDWLKWWGWPFLITGGVTSLIAVLGAPVLGFVIQRVLQSQGFGFIPPILFSAIGETTSAVTGQILKPVLIESLILGSVGLVMVVVAVYLLKKAYR